MLQRLAAKLPVKRGEGVITSLMFSYIFGVMTLYYICFSRTSLPAICPTPISLRRCSPARFQR
jgi:hypothetical protein